MPHKEIEPLFTSQLGHGAALPLRTPKTLGAWSPDGLITYEQRVDYLHI